jgi:uncharacterized membrane protein HdeD (DUF308 family)
MKQSNSKTRDNLESETTNMFAIDELARNWWVVALRGVAAILFGAAAVVWPTLTLGVLVLLYGAYALVDGVLAIITALRADAPHRVAMALNGVISVVAGLIAFFLPGLTALALVYVIAFWAILTGVVQVVSAVRIRRAITNEWSLILAGILSVVFGVLLAVSPGSGALALVLIIGIYAVLFGIMLLVLSWRLRGHGNSLGVGARSTAAV